MFDSLHSAYAKNAGVERRDGGLESPTKPPIVLSPRFQRIIVVAPTVVLSMWLSSLGMPLFPRVALCLGVGASLVLLVARHQRRGRF